MFREASRNLTEARYLPRRGDTFLVAKVVRDVGIHCGA
jgi:hypothetical protein